MKNLKLFVAAFVLFFAVLVSKATECPEESNNQEKIAYIQNTVHSPSDVIISEACIPSNVLSMADVALIEDYESFNEEGDAPFEFDQKEFLPENFNEYSEDELNLAEHELLNIEEDEPFEFNTKDYISEIEYVSK